MAQVIEMRIKPRGTALERIAQRLRMKTAKTVEMPKRVAEPSVVYDGRKARLTVNSQMAALLAKDDL